MTVAHFHARRRASGLPAVLRTATAIIVMSLLLLSASMLVAAPATARAAEATETCTPSETTGCINGILQDPSRNPIAGVTVTLDGAESATATTGPDGRWAFAVESDGDYTVSIPTDVASANGLAASSASVAIERQSFSGQRQVVRFDKASASSSSAASSGSAGASSGSSAASSAAGSASSQASSDDSSSSSASSSAPSSNFAMRFWQQLYSGIIFGLMLCLMSMGMSLVYGTTGLSSFSHGEQVTFGGLLAYTGTQLLHWPLLVSALFAIVAGALTGWLQNAIIWRPLRRKRLGVTQKLIVTIGLSMFMQYTFQFFYGGDTKQIRNDIDRGFQLGPVTTTRTTLVCAAIAIVVILGTSWFLYRTRFGQAMRAVSDNSALAAASGIDVDGVVRIVWILSCALAALSGVLVGIYLNGVAWNTGAVLLLLMFSAVTLGGLGTASGAIVGSLVIGIVSDMSSLWIPTDMRYASALAILIIVLLIRPQGIFGKAQRVG
ncbi:branched-chain amino acid ABC transporter permease [Pseudoscardovia radai]|uniref:Branched-chain amino acid ABC transporter permease n=1 Tax=Pseudoscardovia radai TaxID=987066 RepID=A0A261EX63_9BIFI|nr:branched-chain amino acid ABC transporter permease [Pseudoscardovia radai]